MENLFCYIPALIVVVALVFGVIWAISPKAAKKLAARTVMFVVGVIAVALILSLHGIARAEWIEAVVVDSQPTVHKGEECFLISVNVNGEIKEYFDSENIPKETIITVDYVDGKILDKKEEPEPIWFPPVLLLGLVAAPVMSKKYKLAQTMPPDLYLPCKVWDIKVSIVYYVENNRSFSNIVLDPAIIKALKNNKVQDVAKAYCGIIDKALNLLNRATAKEVPAYVVAYVPGYKQMAVIACNYLGFLEYWRNTRISDKVSSANALLRRDIQIIPVSKPSITRTPVISDLNIDDKNDPVRQLIKVKYSETSDEFTFRCRKAHTPGDFVCVYTKRKEEERKTYKNVKVTKYFFLHESQIKDLANSLGYPDISEVYCDQAIEIEEAWINWRDPADDPELYAPTEEEIADFEAMREAYSTRGYRDF